MANPSHKRDTNARWTLPTLSTRTWAKVAAPVAAVATLAVVVTGVAASDPNVKDVVAREANTQAANSLSAIAQSEITLPSRSEQASRSGSRAEAAEKQAAEQEAAEAEAKRKEAAAAEAAATKKAVAGASEKAWATTDLNLWDASGDSASQVGLLKAGKQVLVTGRERSGRTEVVVSGKSRWVTSGYLSDEEPSSTPAGTGGTCSNGTSVPGGVSANIKKVHQAVCARYPDVGSYGTFRGDGEHSQGRAIDIMVSGARGWEIAEYVRANASALGVEYVIYAQKIWSVDRSGEGWRGMEDRGSSTANHYDHVHVTTY
ncbi:hypothetical protein [Nocardioides sp. AE5]|uniref:hypothetical protein n=1 Tax=Nocardioides sp. AE5 TaxID=2962573 RepID=UPI002882C2B3|nr:hypothetical protein [Nocardioides sp. AE5]MDT0203299.1 hypothetical protein [Nocardioides sp. AE5]